MRDRTNAGLIHDCEALLEARDTLGGSATLNWSTDTRIWAWDGVIREGDPLRVTKLVLRDRNLDGTIPAALGKLSSLVVLNLHSNMLSGAIPDLRSLTGLEELYLANNELSGGIPESLGNMASVRELWLWGNQLQDTIPDLSGMTGLETLKLSDNMLDGGVPAGSDAASQRGVADHRQEPAGRHDSGPERPDEPEAPVGSTTTDLRALFRRGRSCPPTWTTSTCATTC